MGLRRILPLCAAIVLAGGAAHAQVVVPPPVVVEPMPAGAPIQQVGFSRAVIRLSEGQVWGTWSNFPFCATGLSTKLRWKADERNFNATRLTAIFEEELRRLGFKSAASDDLFETKRPDSGLQVGAVIEDMQTKLCSYVEAGTDRGSIVMTVEWQVYDPLKREVVARIRTIAGFEQKRSVNDGIELVLFGGFRESARSLLADPQFRKLVVTSPSATQARSTPQGPQTPISFKPAAPVAAVPLNTAVGSVVAIFIGQSHGSGFLISSDGYLITNQHVVGDAKYVKVRWSDKSETIGEVIRSDKVRDVALVKVDPPGRMPLVMRTGAVEVGEGVFAVGTPLVEELQNTLTKGVVSALRTDRGLTYIQSDAAIDFGNSGGPLLDERGAVVGISTLAYRPDGVSHNINLFVPIGDAIETLGLKPQG